VQDFPMTEMAAQPHTRTATARGVLVEKTPIESYVPPAKPSLVGLSRAELADCVGTAGVPEKQRKMRVQQLWHWLYVRGARSFEDMTNVSKALRASGRTRSSASTFRRPIAARCASPRRSAAR
jgi:23S rRNA (adenine2503-C2)-methyltransferase